MTADTVGGVWTYAVELARALDARGIEVAIATMGAPVTVDQHAQLAGCRSVTLHESRFKLEWMQDAQDDVQRAGAWLLELERTLQPDLVHLNQFAFGALPLAAPKLVVAHSCVLSWWRAVHAEAAPAEWDGYRALVQRGLQGADAVAAPTQAMLDTLADNYGFAGDGVAIANGCDPDSFAPAPKRPFVLAAGRFWDAAKNLAALEQVAPTLPWPVRVAGSTDHPDGGAVTPAGVECLGLLPREALAQELAHAAVYALPARYEPFGLSVLEAALCGCALVLGDIPTLREVWGPSALYVPPDDHAALRAALLRLCTDHRERARLAEAAHVRARHFTTTRMGEAYLALYARLQPRFAPASAEELLCA